MRASGAEGSVVNKFEWWAGLILFVAFIAADQFIGIGAAVKVLGVGCICVGVFWFFRRRVPVGIEGKRPAAEIGGKSAKLAGTVLFLIGVLLCLYSTQAACVLGWAHDRECANVK